MQRQLTVIAMSLTVGACASHGSRSQAPVPVWSVAIGAPGPVVESEIASATEMADYVPVPRRTAAILGCSAGVATPICAVAEPSVEEDAAFRAEGARLTNHSDARCRRLGQAIVINEGEVRMYRKALVKSSGPHRLFGVGHAYVLDDAWLVRIARRLDDFNERSIEEKTRTLRHEMSHTLGAKETPGAGWTAEDYATNCG